MDVSERGWALPWGSTLCRINDTRTVALRPWVGTSGGW